MSQAGLNNTQNSPPPPGTVIELTGNTGPAVPPDGSGNINVVGATLYTTDGNAGTNTLTINPRVNAYPITPYVVGPVGAAGYQTIQSALDAANAAGGGIVYVQPGTYTENLTLYGNTEVVGTPGNSDFSTPGNCTIINGVHTPPTTGSFVFANISFLATTHIFSSVAVGTAALFLINVETIITNGYIFNVPNWTGTLSCYNVGDFSTNNGVVNNSGGCTCIFFSATLGNGTGQTMVTTGPVTMQEIALRCPWNCTTGTNLACDYLIFAHTVTCDNNATGTFANCRFGTGATPALTMSSSASINLISAIVDSSNNPAIAGAGAGTLTYEDVVFLNNASFAGTLTLATTSWQPYSRAIAATDGTKVGTCAFNSSQFTVDTSGFVSLIGGSGAIEKINMQTGTTPVVAAGGAITFNGAVVAAGTNPVRTDGTGASTMALEVQISQAIAATDATKIGLANFDSARFSVDANGFVTINGAGVGETITGDSGGALSPTAGNWNILGRSGSKTSGSVSTLTIKSPPYADQGGSTTVTLNSGSFSTAAITLTLPASAGLADGDLFEFVCTTAGALVIQSVGAQKMRVGTLISSAAGTLTSTAIGDSVILRFRAADGFLYATSVIGTWLVA